LRDTGLVRLLPGIVVLLFTALASSWTEQILPFQLFNGETSRKPLPATTPGGIAIFDYDGDGLLDLFFANGAPLPDGRKTAPEHSNRLLRNQGNLRFEDVTARSGLRGTGYDFGASVADYDNDGDPDLAVAGLRGVTLYRNKGDGSFEDVTARSLLDNRGRWSVAAAWLDANADGRQDLFIVNYVKWDPAMERECLVNGKVDYCHPRFYDPQPNTLFRNNGDGTFADISQSSGIASHPGKGMSAVASDFDGDGRIDIFVTNDRMFAFYFKNAGNLRFEERAFEAGVAVPADGKPVSGMGVDAQDYDNDGRIDLVYTALKDETFPLYRNTGDGFEETTALTRLGIASRKMSGWGVTFADLDNDGFKDISVACSDALSSTGGKGDAAKESPAWFHQGPEGKFVAGSGWNYPKAMYRGAVAADLDRDGCLDLVTTALDAPARILRNPCSTGNRWLLVDGAIPGARVRVGKQWREAATSTGYASSYAGPLHFGVGTAANVDGEVVWPDGRRSRFQSPSNQIVRVRP
jgi:hypothetical protein